MKNGMKLLLAVLCFALCLPGVAMAEPGEREVYMSGAYQYAVQEDGTAEIMGYYGEETDLKLPAELDGHAVTAIGEKAFYQNNSLTSVVIPEGVTVIGSWAFGRCRALASVTIPEGVTAFGHAVFFRCDSLTSVDVPDSLTTIGVNPFADCVLLETIRVSEENPALTVIDGVLFTKEDMRLVCFPMGMLVTDYVAPEGTREIGYAAFYECGSLHSVALPDSVTAIGDQAFYRCPALTKLNIPEGVTEIGTLAFHLCMSLVELTIPESVTSIGDKAFFGCDNLTLTVTRDSYAHGYCERNGLSYAYAGI